MITTATVITSLTSTVTKVVEKIKITDENSTSLVINSLNSIVSTTIKKTTTVNDNPISSTESDEIIKNV